MEWHDFSVAEEAEDFNSSEGDLDDLSGESLEKDEMDVEEGTSQKPQGFMDELEPSRLHLPSFGLSSRTSLSRSTPSEQSSTLSEEELRFRMYLSHRQQFLTHRQTCISPPPQTPPQE